MCAAPARCHRRLIATLSRIAEQHRLARLTRHGELVLMRTPPVISIGAAQVTLPPGSFLQATVAGEETLAALVSEHCRRAKHIADLFCGVGPFALRLAAKSRVTAFDSDAGAVAALQKAATSTSGLKPIKRRGARPVPPPADAAGTARLRHGRVRSAAAGRAGASDAVGGEQGADGGRGILQRHDVRARREDPDRRRLQDRRRDASRPVPPHAARGIGGEVQRRRSSPALEGAGRLAWSAAQCETGRGDGLSSLDSVEVERPSPHLAALTRATMRSPLQGRIR